MTIAVELRKLVTWLCMALVGTACSAGSEVPMPSNTVTVSLPSGPVVLDAQVDRWDTEQIEIKYTLDNQSSSELVVFDVGGTVLVDGVLRLINGMYEPEINSAAPVLTLIGGHFLLADESIDGQRHTPVPVPISYRPGSESIVPDIIEFCIGFGTKDDMGSGLSPGNDPEANQLINLMLENGADGVYELSGQIGLQSLACIMLSPG